MKDKASVRTGQLSCIVSDFVSKVASRKRWLFTRGSKAASTSLPLTELSVINEQLISVQALAEADLAHCTACAERIVRVRPQADNVFDFNCLLTAYIAALNFKSGWGMVGI